jgi:hypothetical protein
MEIEELNKLYELRAFYEESFNRAIKDLQSQRKPVTLSNVYNLFDKYDRELANKNSGISEQSKFAELVFYEYDNENYQPSNR